MSKEIEIQSVNLIAGTSGCPLPQISILLRGKELKELASQINNEDLVRIERWDDITEKCEKKRYYQEITRIIL